MTPGRRALLGGFAGLPASALAQGVEAWPIRPVRIIVPYPPGGTTDIVARQFAEFMRTRLPQPMIVENRPGAQTNIGTEAVARAPADGHTLLFGATSLASNPVFGPPIPGVDPQTALDPIGMLVRIPYMVAANPRFAANSATELIVMARRAPGGLTIASAQLDFQIALLNHGSRFRLEHVGYRGGAAAMTDAIAGQVDMVFALVPVLLAAVRNGALKAIGITARQRSGLLPDVQTFLETGQSTVVTDAWFALFAPAGTPQRIISRLAADTQAYTQDADARGRLAELGIEPSPATPEELRATLRDLTEEYRALVRSMPAAQR